MFGKLTNNMLNEFINKNTLEDTLVKVIAEDILHYTKSSQKVTLLVSGGSTPIELYRKLSKEPLNWKNINVALVDERFVPTNNSFSNEKLVKENLLINEAKDASFTGMICFSNDVTKNIEEVEKAYNKFEGTSIISILGMGADGHTASIFPKDKASEQSLKEEKYTKAVLNTISPVDPMRRITCSKNFLLKSQKMYLMIIGEEKRLILEKSKELNLPIAYFLDDMKVFYSSN